METTNGIQDDGAARMEDAMQESIRDEELRKERIIRDRAIWHGRLGQDDWALPQQVTYCDAEARPGYESKKAHEYLDVPEVLREKVRVLAGLVTQSQKMVTYTGAGISTSAGVSDYATKAGNSIVKSEKKAGTDANPTLAHYALASLHSAGHLKHWIQQNHDGLPQKAGFPQSGMNEIHGAWFDPSNPVVKMSGSLREDLNSDLEKWEHSADLCLTLGTSLAGMNADRVVQSVCERAISPSNADAPSLGAVIVSIQQTRLDSIASLRIFARIDDLAAMLLEELGLQPITRQTLSSLYSPNVSPNQLKTCRFHTKYDETGTLIPPGSNKKGVTLDLSRGAKVQLTMGNSAAGEYAKAVKRGALGVVGGRTPQGHWRIQFEGKEAASLLGQWWVDAAVNGTVAKLPLLNQRTAKIV